MRFLRGFGLVATIIVVAAAISGCSIAVNNHLRLRRQFLQHHG